MNQDIIINKEGQENIMELLQESSDESSIDLERDVVKKVVKRVPSHRRPPVPKPTITRIRPKQESPPKETPLPDSMFEVFTNPDKTRIESDDDENDMGGGDFNEPEQENYDDPQMRMNDNEEYDTPMFNDEDTPSQGFQSIEDEKQDLIYKFYRMQSKGIPMSRKFNIHSNIKEMRNEYERIKRDMEVNSSIRFSRRMLMACVTGLEFLNKRYDPFDIHLEGWSESLMENVTDYDSVFERLHDKYASKVAMAPEIELMLSLAGSAFMFHLTNTMFSNAMPNLRDIAQQNPDILKNMMQSMSMASQQNTTPTPNPPQQSSDDGNGVREMKPPIFDIQSIMANTPFAAVGNNNFNAPTRNTDVTPIVSVTTTPTPILKTFSPPPSIQMSDNDSDSVSFRNEHSTRTISLNSETQISKGGTRRKRGKKISMNDRNSITI
jgi:hypothetical protein